MYKVSEDHTVHFTIYISVFAMQLCPCSSRGNLTEHVCVSSKVPAENLKRRTIMPSTDNFKQYQIHTRDISGNVSAVDDNHVGVCVRVRACAYVLGG